jgi:nucleotide-binding universal stress UspA family protein
MAFNQLLVPTDYSSKSIRAARTAIEMTSKTDSKVMLLHVIQTIQDAGYEEFREFYDGLLFKARERMEAMTSELVSDVPLEHHVVFGPPVGAIIGFAEEQQVDLIVIGSHRVKPGNQSDGFGTISYKVGALASCPVLIVK